MSRSAIICAWLFLSAGCAQEAIEPAVAPKSAPNRLALESRPETTKQLRRVDVLEVVDAGLGRFLQLVDVEPSFEQGRFQGFRLVQLRPAAFWRDVDLEIGDVVLSVNGMPIERETQAYRAFEALRHSDRLEVSYLRNGQARTLSYAILPARR